MDESACYLEGAIYEGECTKKRVTIVTCLEDRMVMAFVMVRLMDVLILKLATSMKRQLMMTDLVTA